MKKLRGYIFSRPFMGERVPQHVQNLVIRDYCERTQSHYLLSTPEYAINGCHLILEQILDELPTLDGIAAYSVFQLPEDPAFRKLVYQRILASNKEMHFAVEGLRVTNPQDSERIEVLWRVRNTLAHCPQTLN